MHKQPKVYLIGSLRNPNVSVVADKIRELGFDVFDDWMAAGPEADDYWKKYEIARGHNYEEALRGHAAKHVFSYDKGHLDASDLGVLLLPAGKSGHLELGYLIGQGKRGYIVLHEEAKLPVDWVWLTGIYEGEGSLTRNGKRTGHGMQLTVTMKDEDIIRRLLSISGRGSLEGPYVRSNPNWSPMWRWAVRKRDDIFYILSGMWEYLGTRRREQAVKVLDAAGFSETEIHTSPSPRETRFDVMYLFASGVFTSVDDLLAELRKEINVIQGVSSSQDIHRLGAVEEVQQGRRPSGSRDLLDQSPI